MFSLSDVTAFLPEPVPPSSSMSAGGSFGVDPGQGNSLILGLDGVDYRIPTHDDEESATFADEEGMSILADTDGDGRVDYVSKVTFDGQWSAWKWREPQESPLLPLNGVAEEGGYAPEDGAENWEAECWICVERGQWG